MPLFESVLILSFEMLIFVNKEATFYKSMILELPDIYIFNLALLAILIIKFNLFTFK
jgi:hypothetical protein